MMQVSIFILTAFSAICVQADKSAAFDVQQFPGKTCYRNCEKSKPRVCYFDWHLEHYQVLGP